MPIDVIMPRVDMSMEKGTILAWKAGEGDEVQEGRLLFEINTDKATMEIDAPASGRLARILVAAGQEVPIGTVVAQIAAPGETIAAAAPLPPAGPVSRDDGRPRATPLARRLAREGGIDLRAVAGSGPNGRISRVDIERHRQARPAAAAPSAAKAPVVAAGAGTTIQLDQTRRIIAERMTRSVQTAPHFHMSAAIDMTAVLALKASLAERLAKRVGGGPSVTAILVRLIGPLLREHPHLNASVDGASASLHERAHVGVALDRDGDLLVPVVRDADTRSLAAVVCELERLRKAAADRSIALDDLRGSTFTLSNLGMYGVDSFTAILNPPETGILAVGRVVDMPVGVEGRVVLRPIANFTLSADHRLVDGVVAARFMRDLRERIETPALAL